MSVTPPLLFKRMPPPQHHQYGGGQVVQQDNAARVQLNFGAQQNGPAGGLQPLQHLNANVPGNTLSGGAKPFAATNGNVLPPASSSQLQLSQNTLQQQSSTLQQQGRGGSRGHSISALISNSVQHHNHVNQQQLQVENAALQQQQQHATSNNVGQQQQLNQYLAQQAQQHTTSNNTGFGYATTANNLHSWQTRMQEEQSQLQQLEAEDRRISAEEQELKNQLLEQMLQQRNIDQQMLDVQQGWAKLYNDQLELQAAPIIDLSTDIDMLGERVAAVKSQEAEVEGRLKLVEAQFAQFGHLEATEKALMEEIDVLDRNFSQLHARRDKCLNTAERFFDCEVTRGKESHRMERHLNGEIAALERDMEKLSPSTTSGATKQNNHQQPPQRSILKKTAPAVTFVGEQATAEPHNMDCDSIVIDIGEDSAVVTAADVEEDEDVVGTSSSSDHLARASSSTTAAPHQRSTTSMPIVENDALTEADSIIFGLGGNTDKVAANKKPSSSNIDEFNAAMNMMYNTSANGSCSDGGAGMLAAGDDSIVVSLATDTNNKRKRLEA